MSSCADSTVEEWAYAVTYMYSPTLKILLITHMHVATLLKLKTTCMIVKVLPKRTVFPVTRTSYNLMITATCHFFFFPAVCDVVYPTKNRQTEFRKGPADI